MTDKAAVHHPDRAISAGARTGGVPLDGWRYIGGEVPLGLAAGAVVKGTIAQEVRLTPDHIGRILAAAGAGCEDDVNGPCPVLGGGKAEMDGAARVPERQAR